MGKLLECLGQFDEEAIRATLAKVIPPKKVDMLETNLNAMKIGAQQ
jgi:hypothetical protein